MNMNVNPNAQAAAPQRLSALLSQVAVIVSVSTSSLGMRRIDKEASSQSDRAHNAKEGAGKTSVSRLAGAEDRIKEINQAKTACVDVVKKWTSKWGDKGDMLPNVNIQNMLQEFGPAKAEYDRLVASFVADSPRLIANAELNKGTYNVDPPTVEECASAFSLTLEMEQIPDSQTFAAKGMDKQIEEELKRRFEASIASAYQQAQTDALIRLQKPLAAIVERMTAYDQREADVAKGLPVGCDGYFRDTLMTNLHEIAEVFGSFNLTDDPGLAKIAEMLDAFENIDAKDLRNSKELRSDTAKRAAEILATLGDWL